MEAKSNHPEFCTPPCGASGDKSRKKIEKALNETKRHLGVHRFSGWMGSYYQYANRLAALYFLTKKAKPPVPARLVFVYFTGDVFPDGCRCPAIEADWHELIRARQLTLGLPDDHALKARMTDVFLPTS